MAEDNKTYYCSKCNRTMGAEQFYTSNNLEKYPDDGKLPQCKKCLTMHVDNWNPDTYLWILQECDVPYIPDEWRALLAKHGQDKSKMTGMTILGRYLSKMKLKQYREYRWQHNDYLQELANHKIEETMKRQGYGREEIDEAINKATFDMPTEELREPAAAISEMAPAQDYFADQFEEALDIDLTEEDKTYLRLKWGKTYKPEEWVRLEQLYEEMMQSYDIQTAGHIDTLKLICKTSLKANQLIDIGDIEGFQKMSKVYDSLMKSGKFTAAQNKAEQGEYVDSIAELVAVCERDGFIPRFYVDGPQDKVDRVIQDMQDYTHTLITEEMHLGALIEKAVKQIEVDRLRDAENEIDDTDEEEAFEEELFNTSVTENSDQDFSDFNDFLEDNEEADENFLNSLLEEGEF